MILIINLEMIKIYGFKVVLIKFYLSGKLLKKLKNKLFLFIRNYYFSLEFYN